ncbi:IS1380 family transposase, partial [Eubacterium sp. TM06-47]
MNTNIDDPILDADSTMVTTCGNQEASAYIHHYQKNGYHPLVINEYHSKLLLSSLLRTGSAYSS